MTLIVHGSYNGQVRGERDGHEFAFDAPTLANHRRAIHAWGDAHGRAFDGARILFDESDNTYLTEVLTHAQEADPCSVEGCDRPGFWVADYEPACHGHAAAFGAREQDAVDAAMGKS